MEPQTQNPMPSPVYNGPGVSMPGEHKKIGPIVATLVIVLVLVVAAIYIFASKVNKDAVVSTPDVTQSTAQDTSAPAEDMTPAVKTVTNSSTDVNSLQSDLDASTNGL